MTATFTDIALTAGSDSSPGAEITFQKEDVREMVHGSTVETATGNLLAALMPNAAAIVSEGKTSDLYDSGLSVELTEEDLKSVVKNQLAPQLTSALFSKLEVEDDRERTELNKPLLKARDFADNSNNLRAVRLSLVVALKDEGRTVNRDDIDADPDLLGLSGGRVLDLKLARNNPEGGLLDWVRDRADSELLTKKLDIDLDSAAAALAHRRAYPNGAVLTPAEEFLEVAIPQEDTRRLAQKLLGYAAYGAVQAEYRNLPVFLGETSTGKSTLTDLLKAVVGDYYGQSNIESLTKNEDSPNISLYNVIKCRWVAIPELSTSQSGASERLKQITSFEGTAAHPKNSNQIVWSNTLTPVIVTNAAAQMTMDGALRRRLYVVPLDTPSEVLKEALPPTENKPRLDVWGDTVFSDWKRDPENKAAFLEWLVRGYLLMLSEGIESVPRPSEVVLATQRFVGEADPVAAWVASLDFQDPTAVTTLLELKSDYEMLGESEKLPGGQKLKKMLEEKGAVWEKKRNGVVYRGVALGGEQRVRIGLESVPRVAYLPEQVDAQKAEAMKPILKLAAKHGLDKVDALVDAGLFEDRSEFEAFNVRRKRA